MIDLETGGLRPHERTDLITRMTAVAPTGNCPFFMAFLQRIFTGDRALIAFMQRMIGYALTGSTREHARFLLHGSGGNGKGGLLNTIAAVLGDYAQTAATETFAATFGERHPAEIAKLKGARLVILQETVDGQKWVEARLKALTGGDAFIWFHLRRRYPRPSAILICPRSSKPNGPASSPGQFRVVLTGSVWGSRRQRGLSGGRGYAWPVHHRAVRDR